MSVWWVSEALPYSSCHCYHSGLWCVFSDLHCIYTVLQEWQGIQPHGLLCSIMGALLSRRSPVVSQKHIFWRRLWSVCSCTSGHIVFTRVTTLSSHRVGKSVSCLQPTRPSDSCGCCAHSHDSDTCQHVCVNLGEVR